METLNLEKFSPKKAELVAMAESYKALTINGVDDKEGYTAVDDARKELKKTRVQIEKDGKLLRSEAVAFQKAVIEKEKELVGIIEPIESDLVQKQTIIDEEKRKITRRLMLPARIAKLQTIGVSVTEDFLLLMDDAHFFSFFNDENAKYLAEKEKKMKEEQEEKEREMQEEKDLADKKLKEEMDKVNAERKKIEDEKIAMEREKQHQIEIEKAKKEAAENAKLEVEQKAKAEKEKAAKDESDRIAKEKVEKERLEKGKRYKAFLFKHEYVDDENFHLEKLEDKMVLYKKVGEFKF
jgi:hypothetical protein